MDQFGITVHWVLLCPVLYAFCARLIRAVLPGLGILYAVVSRVDLMEVFIPRYRSDHLICETHHSSFDFHSIVPNKSCIQVP